MKEKIIKHLIKRIFMLKKKCRDLEDLRKSDAKNYESYIADMSEEISYIRGEYERDVNILENENAMLRAKVHKFEYNERMCSMFVDYFNNKKT